MACESNGKIIGENRNDSLGAALFTCAQIFTVEDYEVWAVSDTLSLPPAATPGFKLLMHVPWLQKKPPQLLPSNRLL